mgnify:CR=1 FL=1
MRRIESKEGVFEGDGELLAGKRRVAGAGLPCGGPSRRQFSGLDILDQTRGRCQHEQTSPKTARKTADNWLKPADRRFRENLVHDGDQSLRVAGVETQRWLDLDHIVQRTVSGEQNAV